MRPADPTRPLIRFAGFATLAALAPSHASSAGGPVDAAPVWSTPAETHPGDEGEAMQHVRVELGLDRSAIAPGVEATLGVRFVIDEGWHLYWKNSGDSGMPIGVTFEAPEGVRIGALQWPAPQRHEYGHESVDYIYEGEVALLASVRVDETFEPGQTIEIAARFELLACQEACVFGMGERSILIDIAESGPMSVPQWMQKTRARLPSVNRDQLRVRWDGTDLVIKSYKADPEGRIVFMPSEPVGIRPVDPAKDGISETGALRVAYPNTIVGEPRVSGIVELVGHAGPVWIEIETTPPGSAFGGGGTNEPTPTPQSNLITNNRSGD